MHKELNLIPDFCYLIPLIKIHGGEAKYMVGKPDMVGSPHTWWPGQPARLASHQSWPAGWPGHHVCGLPTMYGFPTMYLASPPCILIKGIRHQESGIRYKVLVSTINSAMRKASMRKANKHYSLALNSAATVHFSIKRCKHPFMPTSS